MASDHPLRILWLLNHKTLMPWEVPFLVSLGCEVFTPKVLPPEQQFRSAMVDRTWDSSLTIPEAALDVLNEFDFYRSRWTDEIRSIVNEHFDCVFFMPFGVQPQEVLRHFAGMIVLRAFGLSREMTYSRWFVDEFGPELFEDLFRVGDRYVFGPAYDNLAAVESQAVASQTSFLPMGVPRHMWQLADTWTGGSEHVLFFCPNILTIPEHRKQYESFRSVIGEIPYIIVGPQAEPIDDPNVVGKVDDATVVRLMQTCSMLYYPSKEPRHILYSPVEAAIIGAPVFFYGESLFARLAGLTSESSGSIAGTDDRETSEILRAASRGDSSVTSSWQQRSRSVSDAFTDEACMPWWRAFVRSLGDRRHAPTVPSAGSPRREWMTPPADLPLPVTEVQLGIDFSAEVLPDVVLWWKGLSFAESWGRWIDGGVLSIVLATPKHGPAVLEIVGGAHGPNLGAEIGVMVDGSKVGAIWFDSEPWMAERVRLPIMIASDETTVSMTIPSPVVSVEARRSIGCGLVHLAVAEDQTGGSPSSLHIDFIADHRPLGVLSVRGLGEQEEWGRWSVADRVVFTFLPMNCPLIMTVRGGAYGANCGVPIEVLVDGAIVGSIEFDTPPWSPQSRTIVIDRVGPIHQVALRIPHPARDLQRALGLGIGSVELISGAGATAPAHQALETADAVKAGVVGRLRRLRRQ